MKKTKKERKVTSAWWRRLEKLYPTQKKLADVLGHRATKKEIERDKKLKRPTLYSKVIGGKVFVWKTLTTRHLHHLKTGKRQPSNKILAKAKLKKEQIERYYFRLGEQYPDKTQKELKKIVKKEWREDKQIWLGVY